MWKSRAKQGGRATAADVASKPAADRAAIDPAKGARSTWRVAERATRKALELLDKGDTLGAQRAMITAGIAADKTGQLSEAAGRARERAARLNEGQAMKIAELLTAWCKALGIPLPASVRAVGRELLERAGREDVFGVSPVLAEPAAAEIRDRLRAQLRGEIEADLRAEPSGLPAARASY
jgi:hypothetical protein